jgi:hypothetical protein
MFKPAYFHLVSVDLPHRKQNILPREINLSGYLARAFQGIIRKSSAAHLKRKRLFCGKSTPVSICRSEVSGKANNFLISAFIVSMQLFGIRGKSVIEL